MLDNARLSTLNLRVEIPGPGALPSIAAAVRLLRDPRALLRDGARRYGPVWAMAMPDRGRLTRLVWLLGADGNERILAPQHRDDFSWYEGYRFTMEPMFGRDILFLLDGAAHRERHRKLAPAFHPRHDPGYLATIRSIIEKCTAKWKVGTEIDIAADMKRVAFQVVAELLLGAAEAELPALARTFEELGLGLYSAFHVPLPGFRFFRGVQARRRLAAALAQTIAGYRRAGAPPANMLGALMVATDEAGDPLPDQTLVAEMLAFLFAGWDTTASLLASFWASLAARPDVYRALRDEARADDAPAFADLQALPWLDAALTETERLHPPQPFNLRGAIRDISFRGFDIPRGYKVAYSSWFTGRMPELFERPDEFVPERFLDGKKAPPFSLVAFGGGPRACIGKRFAQMEARAVLHAVLRAAAFDFIPGQSDAMLFNPAMQRRHGYRVRVTSSGR